MAKILEHGDTYRPKIIICSNCNCKFETESPEDEKQCLECRANIIEQQTSPDTPVLNSSLLKERELGQVRHYPGYGAERDYGNPWDD